MDETTKQVLIKKTQEIVNRNSSFRCRYGCGDHGVGLRRRNPTCKDGYVETVARTCGPDYYFLFDLKTMEIVSYDRSDFGY